MITWEKIVEYRMRFEDWIDSFETISKIKHKYWKIVPYDYRPKNLWYKLKCFLWHRYTTIKPRELDHTWCDRCELIVYTNFEILQQFVEEEMYGRICWDSDEDHINAEKEIQYLYNWWKTYPKWNDKAKDFIWKNIKGKCEYKFVPLKDHLGFSEMIWEYPSQEDEEIYKRGMQLLHALDDDARNQTDENLIRLIKIRHYLWT